MKKARLQSLGLAYLSPQNKSLAQSFRYMRNKPTIIAFKTPSLENYEAQLNELAAKSKSVCCRVDFLFFNYCLAAGSPERQAEEGRIVPGAAAGGAKFTLSPINYPVAGKPLEVSVWEKIKTDSGVD